MNDDYIVFLDFDGTITASDVGYEMFKRFTDGATEPTVKLYHQGKITSRECLVKECEIWNQSPPDSDEVIAFLNSREIAPGLRDFLKRLQDENIEAIILSEGFDFYIDRILQSHNLQHLKRITNKANFTGGLIRPQFPYFGLGCGQCSSCKGYHISKLTRPIASAVFIGDGHSDQHASVAADLVFAKSYLREHLKDNGRHHFGFSDFHDVIDVFEKIIRRDMFTASERIDFCRQSPRHHRQLKSLWESGRDMMHVGYPHGLWWSQARYDDHWRRIAEDKNNIYLALEDKSGTFMGEARLSSPDDDGFCSHDLKLSPQFWEKGLGREAWSVILDRAARRWPDSEVLVTPSVENTAAIDLYRTLGFEFDGDETEWTPEGISDAVPVRYRRMIKR
jgi:2-hydroxy-3-keto-5-methylthiopentenyl-1-phosphate phosphatase